MIRSSQKQSGISLIEALIAVVILSFGMLALAALQAQLFRAGAESKARSAATTLAQARIEAMRSFRTLRSSQPCPADSPYCDYKSIATGAMPATEIAGVTFYGCAQVRRFRMSSAGTFVGPAQVAAGQPLPEFSVTPAGVVTCTDAGDPSAASAVSSSVPEFKEITTSVGWFDQQGQLKRVQLTDTIAAIPPDDALQLAKPKMAWADPPIIEIDPNSLNEAGILTLNSTGGGAGNSQATSNPTPRQYVDALSSLTSFESMRFTGGVTPGALQIVSSASMNAVSCVCSNRGAVTSDTLPGFEPTVWDGQIMAYDAPNRKVNGVPVGTYIGSSSDQAIKSICTVCCRDHQDSKQKRDMAKDAYLRFDPYRPATDYNDAGAHQHYGFRKQGNGYVLDEGLKPVGSFTNNEYVEACKIVEVDGRLRLGVDARQSDFTLAAMNAAQSGFEQDDFATRYTSFLQEYLEKQVIPEAGKSTYPAAPKLPAPDAALVASYSDILDPATIDYADAPLDRKLLGFGLYVDFLTQKTVDVYNKAKACQGKTTPECAILSRHDPMEFVPFFALNLSSLGTWESGNTSVFDIHGATYKPQGTLATEGGLLKWGGGSSEDKILGSEKINISNSGLTATVPIDLDDGEDPASFAIDTLSFLKTSGPAMEPPVKLVVNVAATSTITLQKIGVWASPGLTPCDYTPKNASSTCTVPRSLSETVLRLSNYTTQETVQGAKVINNRKICWPSNDQRITLRAVSGNGSIDEFTEISIRGVNTADHVLTIEILDESSSCSPGQQSLTP